VIFYKQQLIYQYAQKQLLSLVLCLALAFQALAQDRIVTGKVTSTEDGSALPGATVSVKGGNVTTITNSNGEFAISAAGNQVLIFSFIGFTKKEVAVNSQSRINVALESDSQLLNEMVVIGYGVQQKSKLTSSIVSVAGKDLANLVTPSFDQQLAGRAAGVQVTTGSGIIGQASRIRIRGTNSITSGGSPLYVVDGVPHLMATNRVQTYRQIRWATLTRLISNPLKS
jgi:hypothetical protein